MPVIHNLVSGMQVQLRKQHPCGGKIWTVTRTGADIGIQCDTCGRRIMVDREEFEKRVRCVIATSGDTETL